MNGYVRRYSRMLRATTHSHSPGPVVARRVDDPGIMHTEMVLNDIETHTEMKRSMQITENKVKK